jgi:hypothetical protein
VDYIYPTLHMSHQFLKSHQFHRRMNQSTISLSCNKTLFRSKIHSGYSWRFHHQILKWLKISMFHFQRIKRDQRMKNKLVSLCIDQVNDILFEIPNKILVCLCRINWVHCLHRNLVLVIIKITKQYRNFVNNNSMVNYPFCNISFACLGCNFFINTNIFQQLLSYHSEKASLFSNIM